MTTERVDTTPQINGNYPLAGERLGPAWRRMWRELGDGQPHVSRDFARRLAPHIGIKIDTIEELLRQAARRGVIERVEIESPRAAGRRTLVAYRRTDVAHATATSAVGGR